MENREAILSLAEAADQLPEETSFCLVGVVGNRDMQAVLTDRGDAQRVAFAASTGRS